MTGIVLPSFHAHRAFYCVNRRDSHEKVGLFETQCTGWRIKVERILDLRDR